MSPYPWGHERPFNAYPNYFTLKYGSRLQKLSINAGFTCPNRDGTLGSSGCSFCNNKAFNPSYCDALKPITQQIDEGISFHKFRYRRAAKYIAYFQPYSNTYKPLEELKKIYETALSHPEISGIAIGTRPDCVDDEKLDYLQHLSEKYFVSIEYGLESCFNRTLERCQRGHSFEQTTEAIRKSASRGLFTAVHLMFGLPGESKSEMLREAEIISGLPIQSVKFHQLQILKNTSMADDFDLNPDQYHLFTMDEYVEFIISFIEKLSPGILIERLSAEVPPRFLHVSPWEQIRSDSIARIIEDKMIAEGRFQGRLYHSA